MNKKPRETDSAMRSTVSAELPYDGTDVLSHPMHADGSTAPQYLDFVSLLRNSAGALFFADLLLNEDDAPAAAADANATASASAAHDRALLLLERAARLEVESGGMEVLN